MSKRQRTDPSQQHETFAEWVQFCESADEEVPLSFLMHIAEDLFTPIFLNFHEQMRSGAMDVEYKGPADLVTEADKTIESQIMTVIENRYPNHSFVAEECAKDTHDERLTDAPTWIIDPIDGTTNFVQGIPFVALSLAFARKGELKMGLVCAPLLGEMGIAVRGKGAWLKCNRWGKLTTTKMVTKQTEDLGKALVAYGFSCPRVAMLRPGAPKISDALLKRHAQEAEDVKNNITQIFRNARDVRRLGSAAVDLMYVAMGRQDAYHEFGIMEWDIAAGILLVEEAGGIVTDVDGSSPWKLHKRGIVAAGTKALVKAVGSLLNSNHRDLPAYDLA